jgi:hypothetical protein
MYAPVTDAITDFQPVRRSMISLECICSFDQDEAGKWTINVDIDWFGHEYYVGKTEDPFD